MGDIEFSEQFLNFILHEKIQPNAGVDVTHFFEEELFSSKRVIWEHWAHCGMALYRHLAERYKVL
jgi:hypothetical protein